MTPRPLPLLAGLAVGTLSLVFALWPLPLAPIGWMFPATVAALTYPWQPTRAFGIGALAAACGAVVAVAVFTVVTFVIFPVLFAGFGG